MARGMTLPCTDGVSSHTCLTREDAYVSSLLFVPLLLVTCFRELCVGFESGCTDYYVELEWGQRFHAFSIHTLFSNQQSSPHDNDDDCNGLCRQSSRRAQHFSDSCCHDSLKCRPDTCSTYVLLSFFNNAVTNVQDQLAPAKLEP